MTAQKPDIDKLPAEIPIFPLKRVVLLPHTSLPLNIFEPRYLAMTNDAMAHGRLIGMIQPREDGQLFTTGCAGRITSFAETDDGRYQITLKGVCRFHLIEQMPEQTGGFLRARVDWQSFTQDLAPESTVDVCRDAMMQTLRVYLDKMGMLCDQWDNMRSISCERLVSTLAVICPFGANEKQMLLEARDLPARMKILHALLHEEIGRPAEEMGECPKGKTCH